MKILKAIKEYKMYYTYMLRCSDNSIYTGITTNPERRFNEHLSKGDKCAKYTLNHHAIKFEIVFESKSRSLASKLEYYIKTLTKTQKEEIIKNKDLKILSDKIEINEYKIIAA